MSESLKISYYVNSKNDQIAKRIRDTFAKHGLAVVNMISSPGAGKTSLLERMAEQYRKDLAVITGDIQTTLDADRLNKAGCRALQIETGGACHLTADMIFRALDKIDLTGARLLVIENVGNLVCPSTFDLGEDSKIAVLSVTEGDEKPAKYPALFSRAKAVIINKVDLLPYVKFDIDRAESDCRKLNASAKIFRTSCSSGEGLQELFSYLGSLKAGHP